MIDGGIGNRLAEARSLSDLGSGRPASSPGEEASPGFSLGGGLGDSTQSIGQLLRGVISDLRSAGAFSPPDGPGPNPGEILGGTNVMGDFIDPVAADTTRAGGTVPVADLGIKYLGTNDEGKALVEVSLSNTQSENGIYLTPAFVGVSDGSFDLFNEGEAASAGLESLAEDGASDTLISEFEAATNGGGVSTVLEAEGGGPFEPGSSGSVVLELDPNSDRFLTFAQMVLPSNDAFLSSGDDAQSIELFDEQGNFVAPESISYQGNDLLDAGTEVNTEEDAAFINQTAPDTGIDENGVVGEFPGFIGSQGQRIDAAQDLGSQVREILSTIRSRS